MVFTTRVKTTLFAPTSTLSESLIRLPPSVVQQYETRCEHSGRVVVTAPKPPHRANLWSSDEHDRFLQGLELFPNGPWKEISAIVGTKTTRQTMTHAQKYRQKIERRLQDRSTRNKKRRVSAKNGKNRTTALSALEKIDQVYGPADPMRRVFPWHGEPMILAALRPTTEESEQMIVSSPTDVASTFDSELEALLACLDPTPAHMMQAWV